MALPAKVLAVTPWQYVLLVTEGTIGLATIVIVWVALVHPLLLAATDKVPPTFPVVVVIVLVLIPAVIVHVLEGNVQI